MLLRCKNYFETYCTRNKPNYLCLKVDCETCSFFCTFDVELNTKRCRGKKETSSMFCMPLHTLEGKVHFGELDAEKHISL